MSRLRSVGVAVALLVLTLAASTSVSSAAAGPQPDPTEGPTAGRDRSAPPGALGANFNQNLDNLDFDELRSARARWVRGFFPMPAADEGDPAEHFAIETMLQAERRGYHTILSLKFPFPQRAFPVPGSEAMARELDRLDRVLPLVMGQVDILVIGNEPFIESRVDDRDESLNVFYETMAEHVIAYRREHCGSSCSTNLYMGALNRLDLPNRRTPATERWMTFVRETPEIEGTDIHPHVPNQEAVQEFLDYILPRMRPDQTFLVTEFSMVWHWKAHLEDPAPADFLARHGFPADFLVWQVIKAAIDDPFSQEQWNEFLSASPWFESQKHFLCDQITLYRETGQFAVATYGFRQDELMVQNFGPDKNPWLLNSVIAPHTVQPDKHGDAGRGYAWIDDFRALQRGHSTSGCRS